MWGSRVCEHFLYACSCREILDFFEPVGECGWHDSGRDINSHQNFSDVSKYIGSCFTFIELKLSRHTQLRPQINENLFLLLKD